MPVLAILILLQAPWLVTSTWPQSVWPTEQPPHIPRSFHISDFTDPQTGLNPFIDVPEGINRSPRPPGRFTSLRPAPPRRYQNPVEGEVVYRPRFSSIPIRQDVSSILPRTPPASFVPRQRGRVFKPPTNPPKPASSPPETADDFEDDAGSEAPLSEGTIWTLVLCGVLLFCALVFFATLLTVCMYKQRRTRVVMSKARFIEEGKLQKRGTRTVVKSKGQVKQQLKG